MKHLHHLFREELSDENNLFIKDGLIFIRSRYWTAADIIDMAGKSGTTNEVFDELFSDWHQDRIGRQIELAEEILERHEQQDRFLCLTEAHQAGSVMPFVGAGLSMPSGYPGWQNFLRKQRRQTSIPEVDFELLLQHGKFEEAAQLVADEQGVAFNVSVISTFGCTRDLSGTVELLPYVFSGGVATTNFDNVLERSFLNADKPITEKLTGVDAQAIRRMLTGNERFLLKLHGTTTALRGRILTMNEYQANYIDGDAIRRTIKALCDSRTMLFIGCSLTVDRTLSCMRDYVNMEGHDQLPMHYAFLADPDSEPQRLQRQKELADCHIYPIWYPQGTDDESIAALLTKLHEAVQ